MSLTTLPTLNPALAPTPPAHGPSKAAQTPDASGAEQTEGFARELDRAGAKRQDATHPRVCGCEPSANRSAAHQARGEPARSTDVAGSGRRGEAKPPEAVGPDTDDTDLVAPPGVADEPAANEPVDVMALIAAGRGVEARVDAPPAVAGPLPAAATLGLARAAAVDDREEAAFAGARPRIGASRPAVDSATRDQKVTPVAGNLIRSGTIGRSITQLDHDLHEAEAPVVADAVGTDDFGPSVSPFAQHPPMAPDAEGVIDTESLHALLGQRAHDRHSKSAAAGGVDPDNVGQSVAQTARDHQAARDWASSQGFEPTTKADDLPNAALHEGRTASRLADAAIVQPPLSRFPGNGSENTDALPDADTRAATQPASAAVAMPQTPSIGQRTDPDTGNASRHTDLHEPVGSSRFAPALGARVVTLVRDGIEQAQMRLNPAELGPIAVHIRVDGTRAEVDFSAAHALTRQALQDAVPALAGALRESGLTLAGGGVFEQPRESRDPGAGATPGRSDGGRSEPGRATEAQIVAPVRGRARGMVDLFA